MGAMGSGELLVCGEGDIWDVGSRQARGKQWSRFPPFRPRRDFGGLHARALWRRTVRERVGEFGPHLMEIEADDEARAAVSTARRASRCSDGADLVRILRRRDPSHL